MNLTDPAPLSLPSLLLNLFLGLGLSMLLTWYYVIYGKSLSNRSKFARNIPMLTMITLLVISIVKSSLALSLGLVGALSIVRFRTAIKDPEELIYLFFAIAVGLGMGADQRIPTLAAFVLIMGYLIIRQIIEGGLNFKSKASMYLNLLVPSSVGTTPEIFERVNTALVENFQEIDFRRMDVEENEVQLIFYIQTNDPESIVKFSNAIQINLPKAKMSIVEQTNMIGG